MTPISVGQLYKSKISKNYFRVEYVEELSALPNVIKYRELEAPYEFTAYEDKFLNDYELYIPPIEKSKISKFYDAHFEI